MVRLNVLEACEAADALGLALGLLSQPRLTRLRAYAKDSLALRHLIDRIAQRDSRSGMST